MPPAKLARLHGRPERLGLRKKLEHSESRLLIVDCELARVAREALEIMRGPRPRLILAEDPTHPEWKAGEGEEIQEFLRTGDPDFVLSGPEDEDDAIALSYTSGTTGNPKGVVTHHRGAFLNAMSMSLTWPMVGDRVVYLWTLPMFHCNGWCFPWTVTAAGIQGRKKRFRGASANADGRGRSPWNPHERDGIGLGYQDAGVVRPYGGAINLPYRYQYRF